MHTTKSLAAIAATLFMSQALAIEPVYEGEEGIRAKVFASNCLACHDSNLTGSSRRGAPFGVDFDTYNDAVSFAQGAINRGITLMNMPPSFSSVPKLNDAQKQALTNWQALGFPEHQLPPIFSSDTSTLNLPKVYIKDEQGNIVQKLMVEMALILNQPAIQFKLTHFQELEMGGNHSH